MDANVSKELIDAGRGYEDLFVPALFEPWTGPVTNAADLTSGDRVLDVACGTGVLARRALASVGPSGRVVGIDPAPGMLAIAMEMEPGVEWLTGTAEALPVGNAEFDAVISQFGMMFFDRAAAAAEMFRVLKPGGRLAVAVWNDVSENPAYADITALLETMVGQAAAEALRMPYSLGNPEDVTQPLAAAGFTNVTADTVSGTARFPSARALVEADLRGWLPLFDIVLEEAVIEDVLAAADERLAGFVDPSGEAVFPPSAHIMTAGRP